MSEPVADTEMQDLRLGVGAVAEESLELADVARTGRGRYEFLDAMRGIGVLAVVLQHSGQYLWHGFGKWTVEHFSFGEFGVTLFFLVSGFIIPPSSERHGTAARFWTSRFFRLFPIYWFFVVAALVLYQFNRYVLPGSAAATSFRNVLLNLTMVQQFLGTYNRMIIGASWTLAYEVCFYLFITLLFLAKLNKRPLPIAVTIFGLAGAVGGFVPSLLVSSARHHRGNGFAVLCIAALLIVYFASRSAPGADRVTSIVIALAVVGLVSNQPSAAWYSLLLFGTMFLGSVLYRCVSGELSEWIGWAMTAFAAVMVVLCNRFFVTSQITAAGFRYSWHPAAAQFIGAYAVFGVALLLRHWRWPRPLLFCGLISYSLYLVHALVIGAVPRWSNSAAAVVNLPAKLLTFGTWVMVALLVSAGTYYVIERPFHNYGRKLARRP